MVTLARGFPKLGPTSVAWGTSMRLGSGAGRAPAVINATSPSGEVTFGRKVSARASSLSTSEEKSFKERVP